MNRRTMVKSLVLLGVTSCFGLNKIFDKKGDVVQCDLENFWDTVKYQEEIKNGVIRKNIYLIENYPTCTRFKKIQFEQLKKNDYFIILTSKLDYMGPSTGYGYISKATSNVFKDNDDVGVQLMYISMPQCWTEKAFGKHMILSGADYTSLYGHNVVRVS